MRISSSVTTISWIPSELIGGGLALPFEVGFTHYDVAPPDKLGADVDSALAELRDGDRFRFANHLEAWIDVARDGTITRFGRKGGGLMGSTTVAFGVGRATFAAPGMPDLKPEAEVGDGWVRFRQTAGGRTGVPAPRRVRRKPFVQIAAPLVWTTAELTLHADGRVERTLAGASKFPRHWVYDDKGDLTAKVGLTDFKTWWRTSFGKATPWGDVESPAFVTAVETALERELSNLVMRGGKKPDVRKVKAGKNLTTQGEPGNELYLLLDGVLSVEVDGERLGELGPGAIMGERALLEGGTRTSTLRAVTDCRVAVAPGDRVDRDKLLALSQGHRREKRK
ncbi:MAG TPA: cyclic nucleotide-binding domain-containing protein [Acidimicrobiales bacterium]